MWNVCSQLLIIRESIDHPLAFCVRAFRRATRVIGGIVTATWAARHCWRRTAGSSIRGTTQKVNDGMRSRTHSGYIGCHTIMNCTEACPKDLNPAKALRHEATALGARLVMQSSNGELKECRILKRYRHWSIGVRTQRCRTEGRIASAAVAY
jgi:ribosomal protein S26